ncbi:hypothetical protein Tsubulata_047903 [Turnera subulata]|uniref:Uncharacterized protein n=1 Tax=Turnera subulata TaxID=218843 RepID=A0A9Q0G2G4_9ROSI|nr:hypothetical protein Tsubulata_047903 [Turnera subulata]
MEKKVKTWLSLRSCFLMEKKAKDFLQVLRTLLSEETNPKASRVRLDLFFIALVPCFLMKSLVDGNGRLIPLCEDGGVAKYFKLLLVAFTPSLSFQCHSLLAF